MRYHQSYFLCAFGSGLMYYIYILQKIVLFQIDNETYVRQDFVIHWLGRENFLRRTRKRR